MRRLICACHRRVASLCGAVMDPGHRDVEHNRAASLRPDRTDAAEGPQGRPVTQAARSQAAASGAPAPSTVSELQALQAQREAIDADHIQQLQVAFGPARFGYLDIYVRATTTVQPMKLPPANAATTLRDGRPR